MIYSVLLAIISMQIGWASASGNGKFSATIVQGDKVTKFSIETRGTDYFLIMTAQHQAARERQITQEDLDFLIKSTRDLPGPGQDREQCRRSRATFEIIGTKKAGCFAQTSKASAPYTDLAKALAALF